MNRLLTPPRLAAGGALLAILVHLGALANGFAYDDLILIAGDPGIRSLDGLWARLLQPSWPGTFGVEVGAWRPVTTGSWALVWAAFGESTIAFHAFGIVLHAVATVLVILVFIELVPIRIAALAGGLFAVHPVHTEAVANVVGSAEPLAATFVLAATLLHLRGERPYGIGRAMGVTTLYAFAVLTKESAAVLPLLLVLLDAARSDPRLPDIPRYARERFVVFATMTAVLAVILVWRAGVVGGVTGATYPQGGEILRDAPRMWTVFSTWPHVLRLLFFPASLSPDYAPGIIPVVFHWSASAILGVIAGLGCLGGAWWAWRSGGPLTPDHASSRIPALGLLWIPAALLPAANVLYLGPVLVAERTLYVASMGACLIVAWLVARLVEERGARAWALAGLLLVAGSARTIARVPAWVDTDTVMNSLIENHPESGTGWITLGRRFASQGRQPDALRSFAWGVTLLNSEYRPSTEVASLLTTMGRVDQARFFLRRAWREHPEWYTAPGLLAAAELNAGRPVEAAAAARAATILETGNPHMFRLLAQAYRETGEWERAAEAGAGTIRAGGGESADDWLALARDRHRSGQPDRATIALDSAAVRVTSDRDEERLSALRDSIAANR